MIYSVDRSLMRMVIDVVVMIVGTFDASGLECHVVCIQV